MPWADNPVVPFDQQGNMLKNEGYGRRGVLMVRVEPVAMSLKFKHFRHHSSSMSVVMEDNEGHTYPMFLSDFEKILPKYPLDAGATPVLRWDYIKKGQTYGIKVADDQEGI